MPKSIIQSEKVCYFTESTINLHLHHIMGGPFRKKAEKYGLIVWLRADYHVCSNHAVHENPEMLLELRRVAQKKFEEIHSHELWMKEFKRNYL